MRDNMEINVFIETQNKNPEQFWKDVAKAINVELNKKKKIEISYNI